VKAASEAIAALKAGEIEAELKSFVTGEAKKLEGSTKNFDGRLNNVTGSSTKLRAEATKKENSELQKLNVQALAMIHHHQCEKKLTNEEVFTAVDKNKNDKVEESELVKFFASCEKKAPKEGEAPVEISKEDCGRLFNYLDDEDEGFISKEKFINLIRRFMKVVKASVISEEEGVKSTILRRLEEGEVIEVLQGPTKDPANEVERMRVKAMQDDKEGWVTPVGNAGTVFFEKGGNEYKVVKETILTGSFVIGGDTKQKDKKLKVGEILEVREWAKKEESSGLMRMKVRVKSNGQVGYATVEATTGVKFLEIL